MPAKVAKEPDADEVSAHFAKLKPLALAEEGPALRQRPVRAEQHRGAALRQIHEEEPRPRLCRHLREVAAQLLDLAVNLRALDLIDDARQRVFRETGGAQVILSPVGSKAVALGMLMAALEKSFAVVLVESLAYKAAPAVLDVGPGPAGELVHIWLHGEAYAPATREVGT